jgi:hypothetical protein
MAAASAAPVLSKISRAWRMRSPRLRPWCGTATCPGRCSKILFQTADAITPELAAIGLLAAAVGSRRKFGID